MMDGTTFQDFIAFVTQDRDTQLQAAYIASCLLLLMVVLFVPKSRRGRDEVPVAGLNPAADKADRKLLPRVMRNLDGPGLGAILHLLVILGTATAALIGWRIPAEIERIYGDGAGFGLIFPNVTMPTIGKAAQVIGAATFALCALRLLRIIVPLIALVSIALVAVLAFEYVFDVTLLRRAI